MEVSGVVSRCLSGAGLDTQSSSKPWVRFSGCDGDYSKPKKVSCVMRSSRKVWKSGFSDNGHLRYYVSPKAGFKENNKVSEKESLKKKLKLVKGMSKDLLRFSSMDFGGEIKGMKISEATEILLSQLKQLKAEEKELKRKRKQEKAKLKASGGSSSSSSSESSDSETRQVIDMASLTKPIEPQGTSPISTLEENAGIRTSGSGEISVTIGDKIEVCTGRKCNKSGATALIKEFQQRLGGEDAVVGCKCMGKCKEGPNVRVLTQSNQTNPLCLGVGLDDVGTIVSNFFGEGTKDLGLVVV